MDATYRHLIIATAVPSFLSIIAVCLILYFRHQRLGLTWSAALALSHIAESAAMIVALVFLPKTSDNKASLKAISACVVCALLAYFVIDFLLSTSMYPETNPNYIMIGVGIPAIGIGLTIGFSIHGNLSARWILKCVVLAVIFIGYALTILFLVINAVKGDKKGDNVFRGTDKTRHIINLVSLISSAVSTLIAFGLSIRHPDDNRPALHPNNLPALMSLYVSLCLTSYLGLRWSIRFITQPLLGHILAYSHSCRLSATTVKRSSFVTSGSYMLGSYPLTITEENLHKDLETGDTQETDLSSPASFVGFSPPPSPIASLHQPPPTIPDPKGQQPEELRQIWSKVLTYYCQDKRIGEEVGSRTAVQLPKDVGALLLSVVEIKGTQSAIDFILSRDFSVASLDTQMESKIQLNLIRRDWRGHIKACGQGSALLQWNVPKFP